MVTASPLSWPAGWPRTEAPRIVDGKFRFKRTRWNKDQSPFWTFAEARDALLDEARKLGVRSIVLSTNFPLGRDGGPVEGKRRPEDQGVAIYFERRGRALVMAADSYMRAEENMRSLALALEGLRQVERHGGGVMMERAFDGFAALPSFVSSLRPWREVFGISGTPTKDELLARFRKLAKERHRDTTGSDAEMVELLSARDQALKEITGS